MPQDSDVVVAVGAALLMVEAQGMEQLVLDGVVVEAAITVQGQRLGVTDATHVGVTATCTQNQCRYSVGTQAGRQAKKNVEVEQICHSLLLLLLFVTHRLTGCSGSPSGWCVGQSECRRRRGRKRGPVR